MELEFKFIEKDKILIIMPLLLQLNTTTPENILKDRVLEMVNQNYKCIGIFADSKLIGICGLWFMTRHYSGKSIEPDHVVIDKSFQNRGIGEKLFQWIFAYAKANNYLAVELNSYVRNTRSHKFYYNLDFEIMGYHFVNILK